MLNIAFGRVGPRYCQGIFGSVWTATGDIQETMTKCPVSLCQPTSGFNHKLPTISLSTYHQPATLDPTKYQLITSPPPLLRLPKPGAGFAGPGAMKNGAHWWQRNVHSGLDLAQVLGGMVTIFSRTIVLTIVHCLDEGDDGDGGDDDDDAGGGGGGKHYVSVIK